jgi:hypothetical protein
MIAYFVLVLAFADRIFAHMLGPQMIHFTAMGGSLLYFGARRSRWNALLVLLMLMAADYYLTTVVYRLPFHAPDYLVTWAWGVGVFLLGHGLLSRKTTLLRVVSGVVISATAFFVASNFAFWMGYTYPHSMAGLATCFAAGLPFYRNDLASTAVVAGVLFGVPALARKLVPALRERTAA